MTFDLNSMIIRIFQLVIVAIVFIMVTSPQVAMQQYDRDIAVFQSKSFFEVTEGKGWNDIVCQKLSTQELQIKCLTTKHQEELLSLYSSTLNAAMDAVAFGFTILVFALIGLGCMSFYRNVIKTSKEG